MGERGGFKYFFPLSFLFPALFSFSQNPAIDSLQKSLLTAKEDTNKVKLLNDISKFYLYYLPPKATRYADEALALSNKLNFKNGIAESYLNLGYACYRRDDYNKEIEYIEKALPLFAETKNKIGIGYCYIYFAEAYC